MAQGEQGHGAIEELVRELPDWKDRSIVVEAAIPVLASPSWRGVDGLPLQVRDRDSGASLFVKKIHPDTAYYIDVAAAFDAAEKAGAIGVGPKVLKAAPEHGILVMEDLMRDWRVAGLEATFVPGFVDKVLEKRKAFTAVAPLRRKADVFADLESLYALVKEKKATVPSDTEWVLDLLRLAGEACASTRGEPVPIHGDGNISNILVNASGDVMLVDFDRAGNGDFLEDVGSFLAEAYSFEAEARDAFIRFFGRFDEAAFDRARLLGIADDLRWGLIGALQAHLSPRREHEFYKYANWRFLRARTAARDPRYSERLRRVA